MLATIDEAIGTRIRDVRILAGMTQQELASRVGVTAQQVQKYEYGASRISVAKLLCVTEAAGISMGLFFHGISSSAHSLDHTESASTGLHAATTEQRQEIELMRSFRRLRGDALRRWALNLLLLLGSGPSGVTKDDSDEDARSPTQAGPNHPDTT